MKKLVLIVCLGSVVSVVPTATMSACTYPVEYACDETRPCLPRYPDRPFCDLEGIYPGSEGIGKTCVANPFDAGLHDGALADGPMALDAAWGIDAPTADAASTVDGLPVDAGPIIGPSCTGLPATCGAGGNETCCASSWVPGGTFYRGYDAASDLYTDMSYPATVSSFYLDTYEITVGRFRAFLGAGKGTQQQPPDDGSGAHPLIGGSGWKSTWNSNLATNTANLYGAVKCDATYQTWTDVAGANENKPMNCISWYEAFAFCIWDGGFLPTQAEWNYAAAGGSEQRAYPWSSPAGSTVIDSTYAVYTPTGTPAVVSSRSPKGDARWGHSDMAGNVKEWLLDWLSAYQDPCTNCANLTEATSRNYGGGSWFDDSEFLRTALVSGRPPDRRYSTVGARCARSP